MNKYIRLSGFIILLLFIAFLNTGSTQPIGGKGIFGIPSDLVIESLTITDGDLDLTGTATNHLLLPLNDDATTPTISFGDGNTGIYESADNTISIAINGAAQYKWTNGTKFSGTSATGPSLINEGVTATNPTILPNTTDLNTGLGQAADDQLSLIAGGVEGQRITEASREIEANTSVCVIATDNVTTTAAHALAVDDVVVLTDGTGDVCAPLVSGTNYYVQSITDANNFKVAATRGGGVIDITEDASGVAFTSTELEITANIYGVLTITGNRSTTPTLAFGDLDAFAGDDNTQIVTQCTGIDPNDEYCDMTFSQQVAGNMTAFITADADGGLTFTGHLKLSERYTTEGGANTLTLAECGKVFSDADATPATTHTLPANAGSAGCEFTFLNAVDQTANDTITSATADTIYCMIDVDDASYVGDGSAPSDVVTFVNTADTVGDYVICVSDGTSWFCRGVGEATGSITCTG